MFICCCIYLFGWNSEFRITFYFVLMLINIYDLIEFVFSSFFLSSFYIETSIQFTAHMKISTKQSNVFFFFLLFLIVCEGFSFTLFKLFLLFFCCNFNFVSFSIYFSFSFKCNIHIDLCIFLLYNATFSTLHSI